MEEIKQYLLAVICASAVCTIIITISQKNGVQTAVIKLLCAFFISITAISPWLNIKINDLVSYYDSMQMDAVSIVDSAVSTSETEAKTIIKERIEEYIYDKATMLEANINVNVTLSDDKPYVPVKVVLCGVVSPFNRQQLQRIISDDLGIPEVNQEWN